MPTILWACNYRYPSLAVGALRLAIESPAYTPGWEDGDIVHPRLGGYIRYIGLPCRMEFSQLRKRKGGDRKLGPSRIYIERYRDRETTINKATVLGKLNGRGAYLSIGYPAIEHAAPPTNSMAARFLLMEEGLPSSLRVNPRE